MYPLVKINYRYFIGYLCDGFQIKPLHIMLPKTRVYARSHDGRTEWIYFLIEDDDILEKYNTIWDKISADIKKEFGSKTAYNISFFLETKMKLQFFTIKKFQRQVLIIFL